MTADKNNEKVEVKLFTFSFYINMPKGALDSDLSIKSRTRRKNITGSLGFESQPEKIYLDIISFPEKNVQTSISSGLQLYDTFSV